MPTTTGLKDKEIMESHDEDGIGRRKFPRRPTCIAASITDELTAQTLPCTIRDVNPVGCKIESDHLDLLGDHVVLSPPGFNSPISGSVVWRGGKFAGISFAFRKRKKDNIWINIIQSMQKKSPQQHPRYYELWFNYVTRTNGDLTKILDAAIEEHGDVPEILLDEIYETYLSPSRNVSKIEDVNSKFIDEFEFLETALSDVSESNSNYEKSLSSASALLGGAENGEQVQAIVGRLIKATKEMELKSHDLEGKLASSRVQIDELKSNLKLITAESLTDALTGLANRKHFDEFLQNAIDQAEDSNEPLALLLCDIDHFKKFNDSFGHLIGDQVLQLVAQVLGANVKGRDLSARYGGEEFALILPHTSLVDAMTVADHIRELISKKELTKKSGEGSFGTLTMSFGVALYRSGEDAKSFIGRSDAALYLAKQSGRNLVKSENDKALETVELSA